MIYIIYVHIFHLCTSPSYNIVRGKKKIPFPMVQLFSKKKKKTFSIYPRKHDYCPKHLCCESNLI